MKDLNTIPSHLKPVNPNHLPLLNGLRMYCPAKGNGACSTNCASMHMMEDNSEKAMLQMKSKINHHIADNFENVYSNIIGFPYSETVFGEEERVICNTPQELKVFLRSDKALQVYSNVQELQALANVFNIPISVFTHGTRVSLFGDKYQVAEWMEPILPMKEAANLAEYREGHFPPMALYHSNDTHFDLLVADSSRLVTNGLMGSCQEDQVLQGASILQVEKWQTVPKQPGGRSGRQKKSGENFSCNECEAELESQGLLDSHKYNHEEMRAKPKFHCDDCDEECGSEENIKIHMRREHDDGTWTCDNCDFQSNTSESLRQHLKKTGHQPSEASRRQTNELKKCYTCKNEFEGYIALMDHRADKHPSNKICNKIPQCNGWVNGKKCWYLHPDVTKEDHPHDSQQEKEIECRRCNKMFKTRNIFMDHYTESHTSHIVCRDWLKSECKRSKCWYRHSNLKNTNSNVKSVPTQQDFPPAPVAHRPPAQDLQKVQLPVQPQVESYTTMQQMLSQMAMRMNTLELGITESRNQMHTLQQILAKTIV